MRIFFEKIRDFVIPYLDRFCGFRWIFGILGSDTTPLSGHSAAATPPSPTTPPQRLTSAPPWTLEKNWKIHIDAVLEITCFGNSVAQLVAEMAFSSYNSLPWTVLTRRSNVCSSSLTLEPSSCHLPGLQSQAGLLLFPPQAGLVGG